MQLTYEELIAPSDIPITLSIGHVKNHSLREIWKHGLNLFRLYQVYLSLTPYNYYTQLNKEEGKVFWENLSEEQRNEMSMYDIIMLNKDVALTYEEIFNFFFEERVVFKENIFLLLHTNDYETDKDELEISQEIFSGAIHPKNFDTIINIIKQVCCMKSDDILEEKNPTFKNEKAKKIYEKLLKAKQEGMLSSGGSNNKDLSLANIISSVSAKSNSLNIVNIWDSTLFQLHDQFDKTQSGDIHYINSVRVAVWGDEKNKFDPSLWYKNNYNK